MMRRQVDKDKSDVPTQMRGDGVLCICSVNDSSPKIHVETLTPTVTVFGDKACEEVINVKCGHKGRSPIQ